MPGFCVNCGAPITGAFCVQCGGRVQGAAPAQPQQTPAAVRPTYAASQYNAGAPSASSTAAKGGGAGKVILIAGGVFAVLAVLAVAGALYGMYWVKHKVSTYTSAVTGGSSTVVRVTNGNMCHLLSVSDLQQILGVPIERTAEITEGDTPGCAYYTNPAAFTELRQMAAEQAKKQAETANKLPSSAQPNSLPELLKNANQLEGVVKTLGLSQTPEDGQVFSFTIERNADPQAWNGARLVQAAVPGFEEVNGVGDRAMMGAFGHAFYAQKGDAILYLNTLWVPDARTRGAQIVNRILANL
jgi:hypothetical protein